MDFTETAYRDIISIAANRFRFLRFDDALDGCTAQVALWRHDIDFSPQRAQAIARIESEQNIIATYFVQLTSRFYNVFEAENMSIIRNIIALGHDIGLHFDPEASLTRNVAALEQRLIFEANVLQELVEAPVKSFTLHNPTTIRGFTIDDDRHSGLINGSSSSLRQRYYYCSDSNGIWRFRSLHEVIEDKAVKQLYALTHPEWWQETVMSPREKIQRCIDGRANTCGKYYDDLLLANNRQNILKNS